MSEKTVKHYPGSEIDVYWDSRLCIHAGECIQAEGDVFENGRSPWCDPDQAARQYVRAIVERCPSGALSYTDKITTGEQVSDNTIKVVYNGPLLTHGELNIQQNLIKSDGIQHRASLCRCGQSANKPFCDNSHLQNGFTDPGLVQGNEHQQCDAGGSLAIDPTDNGPLVIEGNLTILGSDSKPAWQGQSTALCRCGASGHKPFCDGSHVRIGFKSA